MSTSGWEKALLSACGSKRRRPLYFKHKGKTVYKNLEHKDTVTACKQLLDEDEHAFPHPWGQQQFVLRREAKKGDEGPPAPEILKNMKELRNYNIAGGEHVEVKSMASLGHVLDCDDRNDVARELAKFVDTVYWQVTHNAKYDSKYYIAIQGGEVAKLLGLGFRELERSYKEKIFDDE